jgi:hypothetical protein
MAIQQPDTPFKGGTSGKYKLLIKGVNKKFYGYEYALTDADGKEYTAKAKEHYKENALLRCIVTFAVKDAHLVVTDTEICKKQDFTVAIPEPVDIKVPDTRETASKRPARNHSGKARHIARRTKTKVTADKPPVVSPRETIFRESPSTKNASGIYWLTVYSCSKLSEKESPKFCYILQEAKGRLYRAISNRKHMLGESVMCQVCVLKELTGFVYFVSIMRDKASEPAAYINGKTVLRRDYVHIPVKQPPLSQKKSPKQDPPPARLKSCEKGGCYTSTVTSLKSKGFSKQKSQHISGEFVTSGEPCVIAPVRDEAPYRNPAAERWRSAVQGFGKHKCGKPFTCNCCGRNFPANAGVRVELKDVYFCNSCAGRIFEPAKRGNHHIVIPTPMGNKR